MAEVTDANVAVGIIRYARANNLTDADPGGRADQLEVANTIVKNAQSAFEQGIRSILVESVLELANSRYDFGAWKSIDDGRVLLTLDQWDNPTAMVGLAMGPNLRSGSTIALPVDQSSAAIAIPANQEATVPQYSINVDTDEATIDLTRDETFTGREFIDRLEDLGGNWSSGAYPDIQTAISEDPYFPGADVTFENKAEVLKLIEFLNEVDGQIEEDLEDAIFRRKDYFDEDEVKDELRDRDEYPEDQFAPYIDWARFSRDFIDREYQEIEIPLSGGDVTYLVRR